MSHGSSCQWQVTLSHKDVTQQTIDCTPFEVCFDFKSPHAFVRAMMGAALGRAINISPLSQSLDIVRDSFLFSVV